MPVVALSLAACGGPGDGEVAVIKKDSGDVAVTEAQFNRFFNATLSNAQQKPVAELTALKGPDFKACVEERRKAIPEESQRKKTSDKELRKQCSDQADQVRNGAMQGLVQSNWIIGEVERQGITFRKAEVQRELQTIIKSTFQDQKGYEEFLKTSGLNQEDVDLQLKAQLGEKKIQAQLAETASEEPSPAEVRRYFAQKKANYVTPETRDIRLIKASTEANAAAAKKAIEGGESWTAVAKKYSTDAATKDLGGKVLATTADQQPPEFGGTVFKAKKGELLGPIQSSLGWYVVKVQNITPEKQPNFKELEPQLKQTLQQENQQKAGTRFSQLFTARWEARTSCASGYDQLVACGGGAGSASTEAESKSWQQPAPPEAGVPQFPEPEAEDPAMLDPAQQMQQQQAAGQPTG